MTLLGLAGLILGIIYCCGLLGMMFTSYPEDAHKMSGFEIALYAIKGGIIPVLVIGVIVALCMWLIPLLDSVRLF